MHILSGFYKIYFFFQLFIDFEIFFSAMDRQPLDNQNRTATRIGVEVDEQDT